MQKSKLHFKNQKLKLVIDEEKEIERILVFIRDTLRKTGFEKVVVGVSGGVDSATALALCVRALGKEKVMAVAMPCGEKGDRDGDILIRELKIPLNNLVEIDIRPVVDMIQNQKSKIKDQSLDQKQKLRTKDELVRLGNIIARVRMIVLYDLAKRHNALVCGTENKSEELLGYYTRFGDEASDLEPIRHLYKTQVYQLAGYLGIPTEIINKKPTAGLWEGQTDEEELGFTYSEADEILFQVFEKKTPWTKLIVNSEKLKVSTKIINKIKKRVGGNWFKGEVPYHMS